MRFVPDRIAGESPGSPYADEEIALRFSQHISDDNEQDAQKRQHGGAHLETLVAETPG